MFGKAFLHHCDGFGAFIDKKEFAPVLRRSHSRSSTPGEEIQHQIAGTRMHSDNPFEDSKRLLRSIPGLFLPGRRDDGVPPDIRGSFAARSLRLAYKFWGHVGDAVALAEVECVLLRMARVPEDVVVLGRPAFGRARAP